MKHLSKKEMVEFINKDHAVKKKITKGTFLSLLHSMGISPASYGKEQQGLYSLDSTKKIKQRYLKKINNGEIK